MMVLIAFSSTSNEILTTCLQSDRDQMSLSFLQGFHVNDKVLASWSDCRFYPAKVISVNKDGGCLNIVNLYKFCIEQTSNF